MSKYLISCIVPVFNGERYLEKTLESILGQTYQPIEIIVVDDGSTDKTKTIVDKYSNKVSYYWQLNAGPAAARNRGLDVAKGKFVAFLDADDLWHPKKLEIQINCFKANPKLGFCITHVQNFWIDELTEEKNKFKGHCRSQPLPGYVTNTLLARKTLFEDVGRFNVALRHSDDTEWFLRASEHGSIVELLPDVLTFRRIHQNNLSRQENETSRDEYLRLVKRTLDSRRRKI